MPEDKGHSCVEPARGPITNEETATPAPDQEKAHQEVPRMAVTVGKPAPDFEATAYADGGFKTVRMSDYKGQWLVLCFYPGDFTFV
jgi:hypothetical protein